MVAIHLRQKENKKAIERVEAQIKASLKTPISTICWPPV